MIDPETRRHAVSIMRPFQTGHSEQKITAKRTLRNEAQKYKAI
jgi:hypothetical protein